MIKELTIFDFTLRFSLAILLLFALFNKEKNPLLKVNSKGNVRYRNLVSFFEFFHTPYTIVTAYFLVGTQSNLLPAIAGLMQLSLILINTLLKKLKIIEKCNCYGNFIDSKVENKKLLDLILILSCIFIILLRVSSITNSSIKNYTLFIDTFILTIISSILISISLRVFDFFFKLSKIYSNAKLEEKNGTKTNKNILMEI